MAYRHTFVLVCVVNDAELKIRGDRAVEGVVCLFWE
jgi:hypothetical protein